MSRQIFKSAKSTRSIWKNRFIYLFIILLRIQNLSDKKMGISIFKKDI